jgi:hypothetical protein
MVRRSTPDGWLAEGYFPVRVRVAVPEKGFGPQFDAMRGWLEAQFGCHAFCVEARSRAGLDDLALFYFLDVDAAEAFIDRFACGALVHPSPTPEDRPR